MANPSGSKPLAGVLEMQDTLRDIQRQTVTFTLPVCTLAGIVLLLVAINTPHPFWGMLLALGVFIIVSLLWQLSKISYLWSAILLVAASWGYIVAVCYLFRTETALFLLIIPVGLATLTLGVWPGFAAVAFSVVFLTFAPQFLPFVGASTQWFALACIGITWGMIWLTIYPLFTTLQWAWKSFQYNEASLKQAQEFQIKLQQSVQDLSAITLELKRQNEINHSLRLIAEEERRAKQEFVANVSHELRTPLNMIVGFSTTILATPDVYGKLPPKLLADLQVILRNGTHLSELIDDVLDLSQINADRMALSKELADLSGLVQSTAAAVRPLLESKNLYLHIEMPPNLPPVLCDATRIREVLLNLVSNAGRFTEHGGVTIHVENKTTEVVVCVRDTGPGISDDHQKRLFEPFQQVDGSIRRRYGGTGLGLSISKGFIELHHGRMWVESQPGNGAAFYFSLPHDIPAPETTGLQRWFNPYVSYDDVRHVTRFPEMDTRPRLALVERGTVLQELLGRHITDTRIVSFKSIEEAIQDMAEVAPQALFVNSSSIERAIEQLKEPNALPDGVPAVICSLQDKDPHADKLHVDDYLTKPVTREALLSSIEAISGPVETILIVDDDQDVRQLYRRMLLSAKVNYRVLRAADGEQALRQLESEKVDLILLDLAMPRMDGFQFLEARQERENLRRIPVILISALDPEGEPVLSSALGIVYGGGFSARRVLECADALINVLTPRTMSNRKG